jgi:hypothetical protein
MVVKIDIAIIASNEYQNKMLIHSKLLQALIGFTSFEDYQSRLLIPSLRLYKKAKAESADFEYAEPEEISAIEYSSSLSVSMESEPFEDESPLNTAQVLQVVETLQPIRLQAMKHKKKDWNKWARSNNLKDYQAFRIRYKKETCKITGMWRGDKYFLVTDLIAPIPPGREAEAAKHGWGLHIIHDCPTRVVALVKMTYGAPLINKGHGASAQPYELEMLHPHGRWAPIYKAW